MKKRGILNYQISEVVAGMGHRDTLVIGDAGLPIPAHVLRIDLALTAGMPPFLQTVQTVLEELHIEEVIVAEEMITSSPAIYEQLRAMVGQVTISTVPHATFKQNTAEARAMVRTGEFTPYANVILVSGVVF